jgi:type II secretory pathway pseudopilin PulG
VPLNFRIRDYQVIAIMAASIYPSLVEASNKAKPNERRQQYTDLLETAVQHAQDLLTAAKEAAGSSLSK